MYDQDRLTEIRTRIGIVRASRRMMAVSTGFYTASTALNGVNFIMRPTVVKGVIVGLLALLTCDIGRRTHLYNQELASLSEEEIQLIMDEKEHTRTLER